MISKSIFKNDKAVSISIGFMLMFAITVLVFSALILSFYTLSQRTEKSAMQESFKIVGSGLAIRITTVDTLINTIDSDDGSVDTLEYEFSMPESIAGKSYTVNITGPSYNIIMEADNGARTVVPFNVSTNLTGMILYSGSENYKIYYNKTTKSIGIKEE